MSTPVCCRSLCALEHTDVGCLCSAPRSSCQQQSVQASTFSRHTNGTVHLFRFACLVNSSLRFLIPNLHPICTCSCLFTPLLKGAPPGLDPSSNDFFCFCLLYAAWVRSRAERPSVSYTKVVMEVAWTGHNLQNTKTN